MTEPQSILRRLRARESGGHPAGAALNRVRALCSAIPPTATAQLDLPEAHICRFSPDGRYLVCFGAAYQHLVVYLFLGASPAEEQDRPGQGGGQPGHPGQQRPHQDAPQAHAPRGQGHTSSRHTSASFHRAHHALCRDFALFPLAGRGGPPLLLLASHTPVIDPGRPGVPPIPPAQVNTVPYVEATALHLVDLSTGARLDSVTWDNDCIMLSGHAGVSLHGDLLAVLAVRSQQVHLLQILRTGSLVHVTRVGQYCCDEDEMEARRAELAEARWLEREAERLRHAAQLQAQSRTGGSSGGSALAGGLPGQSLGHKRSPSPGPDGQGHPRTLAPALRRPPSSASLSAAAATCPYLRQHLCGRLSQGGAPHQDPAGSGARGWHTAGPGPSSGPGPAVPGPHTGLLTGRRRSLTGGPAPLPSHRGLGHAALALHAMGSSTHATLPSPTLQMQGPGAAPLLGPPIHAAMGDGVQEPGARGGLGRASSPGGWPDGTEGRTGPSRAAARPLGPGEGQGRTESRRPGVGAVAGSGALPVAGAAGTGREEDAGTPGQAPQAELQQLPGQSEASGSATTGTTEGLHAAGAQAGPLPLITGLKQRILAHLFTTCLARAAQVQGGKAARQQARALELRQLYANWELFSSLVVWRVQLVHRDVMLLDLGLAQGLGAGGQEGGGAGARGVPGAASSGWQQTLFLALYNWQATRVLCMLRATSTPALSLLHQQAPALGTDVTWAGDWERFASGAPSIAAARDLLAEALAQERALPVPEASPGPAVLRDTGTDAQGRAPPGGLPGAGALLPPATPPLQQLIPPAPQPPHAPDAQPGHTQAQAQAQARLSGVREGRERLDRQLLVRKVLNLLSGGAQLSTASPFLDPHVFALPDKLVPITSRARACPDAPLHVNAHAYGAQPRASFTLDPGLQDMGSHAVPPPQLPTGRGPMRRTLLLLAHPTQPFIMLITSPTLGAAQSQLTVLYRAP